MDLINNNSRNISEKIKIEKDQNNKLILTILSTESNPLVINIDQDYKDSMKQSKELRDSKILTNDLDEEVTTKLYVNTISTLHAVLLGAKLSPGEHIIAEVSLVRTDDPHGGDDDEYEEEIRDGNSFLYEEDEYEEDSISGGLDFIIKIKGGSDNDSDDDDDDDAGLTEEDTPDVYRAIPEIVRAMTSLVLLLNYEHLGYINPD